MEARRVPGVHEPSLSTPNDAPDKFFRWALPMLKMRVSHHSETSWYMD
jgi:hypothetical protein